MGESLGSAIQARTSEVMQEWVTQTRGTEHGQVQTGLVTEPRQELVE